MRWRTFWRRMRGETAGVFVETSVWPGRSLAFTHYGAEKAVQLYLHCPRINCQYVYLSESAYSKLNFSAALEKLAIAMAKSPVPGKVCEECGAVLPRPWLKMEVWQGVVLPKKGEEAAQ